MNTGRIGKYAHNVSEKGTRITTDQREGKAPGKCPEFFALSSLELRKVVGLRLFAPGPHEGQEQIGDAMA